jgi:maltokinase
VHTEVTQTVAASVLQDMLAQWLPGQRWFPGRASAVGELAIVSDVELLGGDPQLRHLVIEVTLSSGPARFQVLLGSASRLPAALRDLGQARTGPGNPVIGTRPGLVVYDALHDPDLAAVLLRSIAEQRTAGPLRFVREPSATLEGLPAGSRPLTAEQSNTSLVFGETAILKVLRRLFPGANPDLEVAAALARLGSDRVAAPFGWIEANLDGELVLLAVLSEFLAGAHDGWSLATQTLGRLYARQGAYGQEYLTAPLAAAGPDDTSGSGLPFVAEARELGVATAQMHGDMATAFGRQEMAQAEVAALARTLTEKLDAAVAMVPELGAHADRISAAYADLVTEAGPVVIQRIHGDYHLGQVMRSQHGWVALDFEGEPAAPLTARRALAPALRDVAGMLRSFDYAARHQLVNHPERQDLAVTAATWVTRCQDAFCAGYAAGGGASPSDHAALLRALTLEKAVYEVIYEYRHRPSWVPIPLDYVAAA